jgi:hypothetical protein
VRPHTFLDCLVTNPNNEPELSLREAATVLLALVVFVALMAWAAMQWMWGERVKHPDLRWWEGRVVTN